MSMTHDELKKFQDKIYRGNEPGRNRLYTPIEFEEKIYQFIDEINKENLQRIKDKEKLRPFTITGYCVFIGISKQAFYNRYAVKAEYKEMMQRFTTFCESKLEESMLLNQTNIIGSVFSLKNNYGWTDKVEVSSKEDTNKLSADDIKNVLHKKKKEDV